MRCLSLLACVAVLAAANVGCDRTCEEAVPGPNGSAGSFRFELSNEPASGASMSSGAVDSVNVGTNDGSVIEFIGNFVDSAGEGYQFSIDIAGVTSGESAPLPDDAVLVLTDCGPSQGDGSCTYIQQTTVPASGTIALDSFSSDCSGNQGFGGGCAVSAAGTLRVTAGWGGASFATDLTLSYQSSWLELQCPPSNGGG